MTTATARKRKERAAAAVRKRILVRAVKGLVSLLAGASATAVVSPAFREFVGDGLLGVLILAAVPPAVLAANKWWKERRA